MAKRSRYLRFSLRILLLCFTLLCVLMGAWTYRATRQKQAVKAFSELGGEISYSFQAIPNSKSSTGTSFNHKASPPAPAWLRNLMGDDYFILPVKLILPERANVSDKAIARLKDLPYLEELWLHDIQLDDAGISNLRHLSRLKVLGFGLPSNASVSNGPSDYSFVAAMPKLEHLRLNHCNFADDDAAHLARLSQLEVLFLCQNPIGDDGMASIGQLSNLEMLVVPDTRITDRGVAELAGLQTLSYLCLINTQVTDAAVPYLAKMSSLTDVQLAYTEVTPAGMQQLRKALPNCKVNGKSLAEIESGQ